MSQEYILAGTKPGKGTYQCVVCKYEIVIESDDEELPLCPLCGVKEYVKIA